MSIFLTAIVKAKPEHLEEIKSMLEALPSASRQEEACIRYDVHQSIDDENVFILNEEWTNAEGLAVHNEQPYSKAFFASFDRLQENPIIYLSK
ncbi:antibiotic biosynthesis monooxygenase [Chryseobacterium sp. WG14]|uniref:putative quinol monooxygenase n=1 Tax=unclassified Chryseobacterium TaxID=2593645 RepID=UPI00211E64A8|nr:MULTISPECIES: putative quinol monooxygenase [unclassified Chryseobacterium]MCQ9636356.1 antibiotic biosynthesis monooxygenase [Chryseobacterium sp. WG23]MCQ9641524.1 antibiotic biosynthesis monooxygenase [Chryseobacterium sp. WG14]